MERIVGDLGAPSGESLRIHTLPDGSAEIDGLVLVADVNEQFDLHIDQDTYTTVGGFVLGQLGRRPQLGDTVAVENRTMRVEALDWDPRRARVAVEADQSARSSRSAFAMTMIDAPVSATMAIHSVAMPAAASPMNATFRTIEITRFA